MSPLTVIAWSLAAVVVTLVDVVIGAVLCGVTDFVRKTRSEHETPAQTDSSIYTNTQEDQ